MRLRAQLDNPLTMHPPSAGSYDLRAPGAGRGAEPTAETREMEEARPHRTARIEKVR